MNLYLVSQKMGNLGIGLELMIVGMLTVFVILLIVIWGGKLLRRVQSQPAQLMAAQWQSFRKW